jgi:hypothetical protein
MFSRLTIAIFGVVLAFGVIALATSPTWNLADEMAYAIAGEH